MGAPTDFTLDEDLHEVAVNPAALREHVIHLEDSLIPSMFPSVKVTLLGELGVWNRILGEFEKAEMYLRQALRLIEERSLDRRFAIQQRIRLATVLQWQRRFQQSNTLFDELLEECASLDDAASYMAFTHQHAGKNLFDQGRYTEAVSHFEQALAIRQESAAPTDQIESSKVAVEAARQRLR